MYAFLGSHGTGKSTLLKELQKENDFLVTTDGASRPIGEITKMYGVDIKIKQALISKIAEWNWVNHLEKKNYFSTRTIIDTYIYSKLLGYQDIAERTLKVFLESDLTQIQFFYIPIEFEIEDDGVRFVDKEFQKRVDEEMYGFIERYELSVEIVYGTIEERLNIINKFLKDERS